MELAVFALFALLAVASSIVVVAHRNPVYSTMSLVLTLFSVAVLFVLLGAPFIGTLQVLIYAGAILVLFLFVIMLLNVGSLESGDGQDHPAERVEREAGGMESGGHRVQLMTALIGAVIFCGMLALLFRAGAEPTAPLSGQLVALPGLAQALFGEDLLPFEIVGLLLLVAVVGATVVARRPSAAENVSAGPAAPLAPTGEEVQP